MTARHGSWSQAFSGHDVPPLRQMLRRQARERGLDGEALDDFVSALNELLINAVRHGGGRGVVDMRRDGGVLICAVSDDGPGFTGGVPADFRPPPAEVSGGRGLWLAHRLTDGLTIRTGPSGVVASVTVPVPVPDGSDSGELLSGAE